MKAYHIFGQNISLSLSPTLHNAAFAHHGLPHHYDIQECASIDDVKYLIDNPSFGGASVTMPHKLSVDKFCSTVSDSAVRIGAINTLIVEERGNGRVITGDNTDWSGLYSIVDEMAPENAQVGLVIGAGGAGRAAVYAMVKAGLKKIYICNRTVSKAEQIIADFADNASTSTVVALTHPSDVPEPVDVIIGTIPGDVTTKAMFADLFKGKKGLCIEMSYKPRVTPLLAVARQAEWTTADGLEVLLRQAFEQSRLWTGLEVPEKVMREAIQVNSRI
ncbi:hypothetical protein ASPWEDRAFT_28400 [Aspergillus wentii DTO 134E9]|uniref:Shikimate dehydrogenase substrate binding N-terminal domain-containing protein n=1 Tax=Aspergillus wentii DTO 134E9 TaxID=1073089 RepID=A0A1L9RLS7_ASPWE|nr:uncharacterized protein ASPWEDRAFT_28400 [Aspergillus wentii DTO 134E9]KAI9929753.1 hypothetical protein MW887_001229 [Aspergillus wentii]OJJ35787.1 hypothetical protein ASPWEDRAFT_28400 [Aspergillus wentii DTO 134E9]